MTEKVLNTKQKKKIVFLKLSITCFWTWIQGDQFVRNVFFLGTLKNVFSSSEQSSVS